MSVLPHAFYDRNVAEVARDLLGMTLVRESDDGRIAGMIVETEAYLHGIDPASHSYRGPTRRNASMFGPAGRAYVYTIHTRFCLNAVAEPEERGAAVLIRALEPLEGLELMRERRQQSSVLQLASGPGKLCEALDINRQFDGWDLTRGHQLWIERPKQLCTFETGVSPRVGISSGQDLLLRYYVRGSRFVSGPRSRNL